MVSLVSAVAFVQAVSAVSISVIWLWMRTEGPWLTYRLSSLELATWWGLQIERTIFTWGEFSEVTLHRSLEGPRNARLAMQESRHLITIQ